MDTSDDRTRRALRPPDSLPRALAAAMAGFLDEYLGLPGAEVPFAGRDSELRQLDAWLARPDHPVALVASEAGRGKSALLARWAAVHAERAASSPAAPRVVFVPISLRFATALRGQAWKLLAHGLAAALGRALPEVQDSAALRAECVAALGALSGDAPQLLVILDGLDEAADWTARDLELGSAGSAVKLVVSARTAPGLDAAAWRAQLGIAEARCATLALDALDREAVSALLATIGGPLAAPALTDELLRLSEGDPLIVRLYLDALLAGPAHQLAWMTPGDLPRIPPGLDGWFARWWDQLGRVWRGNDAGAATAGALFDVLATALAPLPRADVEALVARIVPASPDDVAISLRALRPLLAGDREHGPFVLAHPRLRYFRLDAMSEPQRARLRGHFIAHGEHQLRELSDATRAPSQLSPYVLQHLGSHLASEDGDPRRLWRLICAPWQRACEAFDGTFDGFLGDLGRAREAAERAVASSDADLRGDAIELIARAALVSSSIASLSFRMPPNLVGHLIDERIWSPAVALSRTVRPGGYASETLCALVPHLDLPLARAALDVCAQHASFIRSPFDAEGLAALVVRIATLAGAGELAAALARFPPAVRALVAANAWRRLPRTEWPTLAAAIRAGAAQVSHVSDAAGTLFSALPILEDIAVRETLIRRALDRLFDRDFGLDNEHAALLGAAGYWSHGWDDAQQQRSLYPRAEMLAFTAPYLPAHMRPDAYAAWLRAYRAQAKDVMIGLRIPARLPPDVRAQLQSAVRTYHPAMAAKALIALAYESPELRIDAIRAVQRIDGAHGALARRALIPALDPADQHALAIESYDLALAELDAQRGRDLAETAQYWNLGPDDMAWSYLRRHRDPAALVVDALAWMPAEHRAPRVRALFARFRRIDDRTGLVPAASAAAHHAPTETQPALLTRLCAVLDTDAQDAHALAALAGLADRCADPRRDALAAAAWSGRIEAGDERAAHRLAIAARYLPAETRAGTQHAALTRWRQTAGHFNWPSVLRGLRDGLDSSAAVHALHGDPDSGVREYTLRALLPVLPADMRTAEATEHFTQICARDPWWTRDSLLSALVAYTPTAGNLLSDALDHPHDWLPSNPARFAWVVAPLCRDGHADRAVALRAKITDDPLAAWTADLALATFGPTSEPRDPLIARTLEQLPAAVTRATALPSSDAERSLSHALSHAFDILAAVDRTDELIAAAASLPAAHWHTLASMLEYRSLEQRIAPHLSPQKLAELDHGDQLLRIGLPAALWAPLLTPARAAELWAMAWQVRSGRRPVSPRRSGALEIIIDNLALAIRAGDALTPVRLADLVLEIGDWFP